MTTSFRSLSDQMPRSPHHKNNLLLTGFIWGGWFLGLAVLLTGVVVAYGWADVAGRDRLIDEGGLVENLTAGLCVAGVLFAGASLVWPRRRDGLGLVLGLVCLTGFLDEISFGMDWLDADVFPTLFGKRIDGVHDLYEAVLREPMAIAAAVVIASLVSVTVLVVAKWRHGSLSAWARHIWRNPRLRLLGFAVLIGITATVLDDLWSDGSSRRWRLIEESLEMSAAWCIAWAGLLCLIVGGCAGSVKGKRERVIGQTNP